MTAAPPCRKEIDEQAWLQHVNVAKRKVRSELSLEDWQKYCYAGSRAPDFCALGAADDPPGCVARESCQTLSLDEFWTKYESQELPCILSGIPEAEGWPAVQGWKWDIFFQKYSDATFKVGKDDAGSPVRLGLEHFAPYMREQQDDSPVYLFDSKFTGPKRDILQDFRVPSYFPDDYMGLDEAERPPYRWFSIGPRRSGTIMHQDPLCTSAWNTVLTGRKLWLLLPPNTPRKVAKAKDVMLPEDDDEAINHFLDLLPRKRARGDDPTFKPMTCVQYPGETIFVPGNWWHLVVNLDDTIAITQNYVGRHNFVASWRSARKERPCWSYRWLRMMEQHRPDLAATARRLNSEDGFDMTVLRGESRETKLRRRQKSDAKALRRARSGAGDAFDETAWWCARREGHGAINSDSTADTSSESSDSTSSESSGSDAGGEPRGANTPAA